jgi:hypothetical protein
MLKTALSWTWWRKDDLLTNCQSLDCGDSGRILSERTRWDRRRGFRERRDRDGSEAATRDNVAVDGTVPAASIVVVREEKEK